LLYLSGLDHPVKPRGFSMVGTRKIRARVLAICAVAALAGGALAAGITGAQAPPDYTPSTTTVTQTGSTTTVTTGGGTEVVIKIKLKGTKGKQKVKKSIVVQAEAKTVEQPARRQGGGEPILLTGHGKIALKVEPGGRGKRCQGKPKGNDKRWKLGTDFDTIGEGEKTKLKLKIPNSARKDINKRAVCKDTKAKAKIRIDASTASGLEGTKDRVVKVRPGDKAASN
jgi:hypothetical protein